MGSPAPPTSQRHRTKRRSDDKGYARRRPEESVLYGVVQSELETFLARAQERERPEREILERFWAAGVDLRGEELRWPPFGALLTAIATGSRELVWLLLCNGNCTGLEPASSF